MTADQNGSRRQAAPREPDANAQVVVEPSIAERFPTITSVIEQAHRNLDPGLWDLLSGGAESETTLRRNRAAVDGVAFRPRLLRGVGEPDVSTNLLGHHLRFPVVLAPVASFSRYHPDGACVAARAAQRTGTIAFLSSAAAPGLEAVRADGAARLIWQLYVRGDRGWIRGQLERAEDAGCLAICLTADVTAPAHRARGLPNTFGGYRGPALSPVEDDFYAYQSRFAWDDVAWLRESTRLPLVVKGITCGEDAELAVGHGAAVVYVSNHGGRMLDHQRGTLDVLPEVVAAVDGRAEVIVDGGFVHGSDVVKALALGARVVAIGKLAGWALAAAGEPGLEHALALLRDEIRDLTALLGARSVSELCADHVVAAAPAPGSDWIGFARGLHQRWTP